MYWFGVLLAILSGVVNNFGTVVQKKVVNDVPVERRDDEFFRTLVKNRLWLFGLVLQNGIGAIFFMVAQLYIGPALIPGLMAAGLIVLALGSIKIVGEKLELPEIIGIILMIVAIALLGLSSLVIDVADYDILDTDLLMRIAIFTLSCLFLAVSCYIGQKRAPKYRGLLLATFSGLMFSLSNFWIFPMMVTIVHVFEFSAIFIEAVTFIIAVLILTLTNIYGIATLQTAFKGGNASLLVPIQQVPIQVTPALVYLAVFMLTPPTSVSLMLFIVAIGLIVASSFLLAKRQAQMEGIQ